MGKANQAWEEVMAAHHVDTTRSTNGTCVSDIREKFPACLQYEPAWCWATAVAEVAHFWNPSKYPETGSDCHGVECEIVGRKKDVDDPKACCGANADTCKDIAGSVEDITNGINWISGKTYKAYTDGPLTQAQLDTLLSKGHPVVIAVFWERGGGHALTLGGCTGGGSYYLHDPERKQGSYQSLTYKEIALYVPPEANSLKGKWMATWYLEGDLDMTTIGDLGGLSSGISKGARGLSASLCLGMSLLLAVGCLSVLD